MDVVLRARGDGREKKRARARVRVARVLGSVASGSRACVPREPRSVCVRVKDIRRVDGSEQRDRQPPQG